MTEVAAVFTVERVFHPPGDNIIEHRPAIMFAKFPESRQGNVGRVAVIVALCFRHFIIRIFLTDNITKLEVFNLVFQYTPRVSQAWTGLVTRMADSFDQAVQRIKIERMTVIVQGGSSQPLLTTNERRAGEAARMASSTSIVPASSTSTVPASSTSTVPAQQSRELTPAGLAALRRAEANQMWPQEINLESGSFPSTVPATSSSSSVGGNPYTFTFPR